MEREERYTINGMGVENLTAKELRNEVVRRDLCSNSWITYISELVRICEDVNFSTKYAEDIRLTILASCTRMLNCYMTRVNLTDKSKECATSCFNSLNETDEKVCLVKEEYLKAIISEIRSNIRNSHGGKTYDTFCIRWEEKMLTQFLDNKNLVYEKLRETLLADFNRRLKLLEEQGLDGAEAREAEERRREYEGHLKLYVECTY